MAFTYDPELPTDRDYLRSLLNDMEEGKGPYPQAKNFTDGLLDKFLSNGGSVNAAYILACRALATAWSSYARRVSGTAMSVDATGIAEEWRKNAKDAQVNPVDGSAPVRFRVFNATVDC